MNSLTQGGEATLYWEGMGAAVATATPPLIASLVSLANPSTPERTAPIREATVLGIPNFFDHAGNCLNGLLIAEGVIIAGAVLSLYVSEESQKPLIIAGAALAATTSIGANVAYEAGVYVPPFPQKPENSPFDAADALFGGLTGLAVSLAFCVAALRHRARLRKTS